jgi:hypothetical protein
MQLKHFGALVGALIAALVSSGLVYGEDSASSRVDIYVDDWIEVVSPSVTGAIILGETSRMDMGYAVDIISGATPTLDVDLVSSATTFEEVRHQGDLSVTTAPDPAWSATATYSGSFEDDYRSNVGGLSANIDLFDRMATLGASYSVGFDRFGTTSGEAIEGAALTNSAKFSWTHILGPNTKGTVSLASDYSACEESLGCHSNPYRYVLVDYYAGMFSMREKHPETRLRGATAVRLSRAIGMHTAIHTGYRYYRDNWEIEGHTTNLTLARSLAEERFVVRADGRASWQSPASFYRDLYEGGELQVPDYRSADPELAGQSNLMLKGRAEWTWFGVGPLLKLSIDGRVARLWYRYEELESLPERDAWVIGGGVNGSY